MLKAANAVCVAVAAVAAWLCANHGFGYHLVAVALLVTCLAAIGMRSVFFLGEDEQLQVQRMADVVMHDGPGLIVLNPLGFRFAQVVKASMLTAIDYARVINTMTGKERVKHGPGLVLLSPHERVGEIGKAISLAGTEYVIVQDPVSGPRVVKGPCVWFPAPGETGSKGSSISLGRTEYIIVEDKLSGERTTVPGPCVWFPEPYHIASSKRTAITLQDDEYLRLKDTASGLRWVEKGRALVFPQPTWSVEGSGSTASGVKKAWVLKAHEYIRFLDVRSGKVNVHRGEAMVFPDADDEVLDGGKQSAVDIDEEHAVLVRDKGTGQLRLVTEHQLFVPGPNEVIEEVRDLIRLAEHEAMIIKDRDGALQYYYGSDAKRVPDQPRAFFLPPYAEIVKIWWSRGPRREKKEYSFERFDLRPHFMKFEFNCRTADNVELVLEGVVFWELVDLPSMFRHTGDTSGDMVNHIRSQFILRVARVSLRAFMEQLHAIAKEVLDEDTAFYATRGIKVYSLEVTRYQCANSSTSEILEQIIQETTNRMNRLSQAESENEVSIFRMQGQVEQSKLSRGLQEARRADGRADAEAAGQAEAAQIATFLGALAKEVPALEDRMKLWQTLRKTDALTAVSRGGANLFFTPNDVDLSIEARGPGPQATAAPVARA